MYFSRRNIEFIIQLFKFVGELGLLALVIIV